MHRDPLDPMRGVILGMVIGLAMWAIIIAVCWLILVSS
jgi:hypothetical protein